MYSNSSFSSSSQEMLVGVVQSGPQLYIGSREMHWGLRGITIAMLSALKNATSEVFSNA